MMEVASVKDFQWKSLAPLPSRRVYCSLVEVGGQVFAIGGCDDNGVPMDSFEVYSPEADQWNSLPPMPTARAGVAVATLGKRIMVIGGVGVNQRPLKIVEMYNVDEGKWKKRNSLREAAMGISVTAKGKEHFFATAGLWLAGGPRVWGAWQRGVGWAEGLQGQGTGEGAPFPGNVNWALSGARGVESVGCLPF